MVDPSKRDATRALHLAQAEPSQPRACDGCTACCVALHVRETQSPAHRPCRHLRTFDDGADGCGIYADRPAVCRAYLCEWALGRAPEWMQPDVVGVVPGRTLGDDAAILLTEVWAGAADYPQVAAFIRESNARRLHVVVQPAPAEDAAPDAPPPPNRAHLFTGEVRRFDGNTLATRFITPGE